MVFDDASRYKMLKKVLMSVRGKHDKNDLYTTYLSEVNKCQMEHHLDEVLDAILTHERYGKK